MKQPEGLLPGAPGQIKGFLRKGCSRGGNGPTVRSSSSAWLEDSSARDLSGVSHICVTRMEEVNTQVATYEGFMLAAVWDK